MGRKSRERRERIQSGLEESIAARVKRERREAIAKHYASRASKPSGEVLRDVITSIALASSPSRSE